MQTVDMLLDTVKKEHGIKSDYKLAQFLELTQHTIANYRHGRSRPDDKTLVRLAELAGVDPVEIDVLAAQLQAERATNEDARMMWTRIAKSLQTSAVHVAVLFGVALAGFTSAPNAEATVLSPTSKQQGQLCIMYSFKEATTGHVARGWQYLRRLCHGSSPVQSADTDAVHYSMTTLASLTVLPQRARSRPIWVCISAGVYSMGS